MKLSQGQRQAIKVAMTSPILILTGGPGCGKTYVTANIVKLWSAMNKNMKLAAPTGGSTLSAVAYNIHLHASVKQDLG